MNQKIKALVLLVLFAAILLGCEETVKDADGNSYRVVTIGEQTWMAENLKLKTDDSYCYDNKEENCKKYGRLYKHSAAKYACPAKWRLPTDEDWNKLVYAHGGPKIGIEKLKTKKGWKENENGTDEYGFGMFPGGEMEACELMVDMRFAESDYCMYSKPPARPAVPFSLLAFHPRQTRNPLATIEMRSANCKQKNQRNSIEK